MKRIKKSGSAYRNEKKARDEVKKRNEGALMKYFTSKETSSSIDEKIVLEEAETKQFSSSSSTISSDEDYQMEGKISSSNLKDVGQWPVKINDDTRILLVHQGPFAVQHIDCEFAEVTRPGTSVKGLSRKLTSDWFYQTLPNGEKMLRSWMVYSPFKQSVYCFCCKLFSLGSQSHFDSTNGFNMWWKLNPKISEHESSPNHIRNFTKWKELEIRIRCNETIDKKEQIIAENETKKWREILSRLLDIIRFLAKQNLAFRGHREVFHQDNVESKENRGNFLELVDLLSKYDPVLREHVLKIQMAKKYTTSYLSPTIQNEFIEILGDKVRKTILEQVKEAKYFCMIFDSTPDISHKDQTSQVIRYVKIDGNEVRIVESFIDFIQMKKKNAEEISNMILKKLEDDGIDIQNCRGQAYDNASVMAGKRSGVQKRIKEINEKAEFVACSNHSLNLACVHAASVAVNSVTFFGTVERLFTFFSSSTHRWDVLISATGQSVKRAIETRWSARGEAVTVVKNNFSSISDALEQLTGEEENNVTTSDTGILLNALQSFLFSVSSVCRNASFWKLMTHKLISKQKV